MNILFTCGGTAGHINPAVALARVFQNHHGDCQILFVGADGGMDTSAARSRSSTWTTTRAWRR